jgi:hypothetical protein
MLFLAAACQSGGPSELGTAESGAAPESENVAGPAAVADPMADPVADPEADPIADPEAVAIDASDITGQVDVEMGEWFVVPDAASIAEGAIRFAVTNKGPAEIHELAILESDLDLDDLPVLENGSLDEAGKGVRLVGEIEDVAVGESDASAFELTSGRYLLICNLVTVDPDGTPRSHLLEGMVSLLEVR